jgi:hypothetical protein
MTRGDLTSFFVPVTDKPKVSNVPGSPLSCTVTVNVQPDPHSPENWTVFGPIKATGHEKLSH